MIVRNKAKEFKYTHNFVGALFAEDLHAKRVYSLANATLGVMTSASLAVSTIGHGLALARGGLSKHEDDATKGGVAEFLRCSPFLGGYCISSRLVRRLPDENHSIAGVLIAANASG